MEEAEHEDKTIPKGNDLAELRVKKMITDVKVTLEALNKQTGMRTIRNVDMEVINRKMTEAEDKEIQIHT